jgi:hypothetical protein
MTIPEKYFLEGVLTGFAAGILLTIIVIALMIFSEDKDYKQDV